MFDTLASQIGAAFMVSVGLFAFLKGDELERIGAGSYLVAWFASLLLQGDGHLFNVQWGMFMIDLALLLVFGAMVWKSRRSWPVWACAFQLLSVMSYFMLILDLRTPMSAFYTVVNLASYGIIIAIAVGTFFAWQERRAVGLE